MQPLQRRARRSPSICEWLLCCCRGRTKWVQVTALLPLLAHIVSNYSSKHWHSMCGLTFIPPPHLPCWTEREREYSEMANKGRRQTEQTLKGGEAMMRQRQILAFKVLCFIMGQFTGRNAWRCMEILCSSLFRCQLREYRGNSHPFFYTASTGSGKNAPYQPKFLRHVQSRPTTEDKMQSDERVFFFFFWTHQPKTSLNFKAQSHSLIWILKLCRCQGASNSSFSKTIIMTNLCISSLPNPLSVSLAWGNAAEKLTQICDMWLPIGNGFKLGTRMVWVKKKKNEA